MNPMNATRARRAAAGIAGAATAILVAVFAGSGETAGGRLTRCTMGFIVAMVWIMAIADEVVEVLQVRLVFLHAVIRC